MKGFAFLATSSLLTATVHGGTHNRPRSMNLYQAHPPAAEYMSGGSGHPVSPEGNHNMPPRPQIKHPAPAPPMYHSGGGSGGGSQADPTHGEHNGNGGNGGNLFCGASTIANHTVVEGDTLGKLAFTFNTGICDIAALNNIDNPNLIILGNTLQIPENCARPDNTTCNPDRETTPTETCVPGLPSTYTVKSGDTLNNISKDFNITLQSLIAANSQIVNPDLIFPGQVINVPVCPNSQCEIVGTHTIQSGDLFVDLAKRYGSRIGQIKALNANADPEKLQPGQVIVLPQGCRNVTTAVA